MIEHKIRISLLKEFRIIVENYCVAENLIACLNFLQ